MTEYESSKWGYLPHSNQTKMTCPKCGHGIFNSYAQTVVLTAKVWAYEYACAKCGHSIAIEVKRDDE